MDKIDELKAEVAEIKLTLKALIDALGYRKEVYADEQGDIKVSLFKKV